MSLDRLTYQQCIYEIYMVVATIAAQDLQTRLLAGMTTIVLLAYHRQELMAKVAEATLAAVASRGETRSEAELRAPEGPQAPER